MRYFHQAQDNVSVTKSKSVCFYSNFSDQTLSCDCVLRPRFTFRLSSTIRTVATGNQWSRPMKSKCTQFHWSASAPLVCHLAINRIVRLSLIVDRDCSLQRVVGYPSGNSRWQEDCMQPALCLVRIPSATKVSLSTVHLSPFSVQYGASM